MALTKVVKLLSSGALDWAAHRKAVGAKQCLEPLRPHSSRLRMAIVD